jgi:hypothetical protein
LWQLLIISGAQQAPRAALETCSETLNVYLGTPEKARSAAAQLVSAIKTR